MNNRTIFHVSMALLLYTGIAFAGGQQGNANANEIAPDEEGESITLLDFTGKEETIELPVERVVVLDSGPILNVISALNAEDRVIAIPDRVKDMAHQYPSMSQLPSTGDINSVDSELVVSLNPDLVIAHYWSMQGLEEQLEPEIQVIRLRGNTFEEYNDLVEKLANIFGKQQEGQDYISWVEEQVSTITDRISTLDEADKRRAFVFYGGEYGMVEGPPFGTFGNSSDINEYIERAGATSIARNLEGEWIVVDPEWVITENPDIIVREVYPDVSGTDVFGYSATDVSKASEMYNKIMYDSAFETSTAGRNEDVYLVFGGFIGREWFLGLQYLAKLFHPELFRDVDPQATHQEFLSRFLKSDYDLSTSGIFVYP